MVLDTKQVSYILIVVAIVVALLTAWYTPAIMQADKLGCESHCSAAVSECPHANNLPVQTYVGGLVVIIIGFLSYSLIAGGNAVGRGKRELANKIRRLPDDEKKIYKAISAADGAMFQSELVGKTKLSKVKISRLLDKLEGKGLVERRRRGMTNLVLLKKQRN